MTRISLEHIVLSFLKRYGDLNRPMLLALSGGPDSLSLLHLLLNCQKKLQFTFGIAHIDHRWRSESKEEAESLRQLAETHQISFHLKVLDPSSFQGNLEENCRQKRLEFFRQLCHEYRYQAVLLGHHANDQAETVLKRLLEGSGWNGLAAMQE